jgi:hypothetical protein
MSATTGRYKAIAHPYGLDRIEVPPEGDRLLAWGYNQLWFIKDERHYDNLPLTLLSRGSGNRLTKDPGILPRAAVWDRRGEHAGVIFNDTRLGRNCTCVAVLDAKTGAGLPAGEYREEIMPEELHLSPEGKLELVVQNEGQLKVLTYEVGKEPTALTVDLKAELPANRELRNLMASPDGGTVLVADDFDDPSEPGALPEPGYKPVIRPPHRNLLVRLVDRSVKLFPPLVVPWGWLDDHHVLVSTGVGKNKRYSVMDINTL